ncbi:hypothetical protein [Sulfuriroseicoccus oceanibius]|uniref:Uncharacterized protein n=1 Tax=Sulfuriroseicoccus oceanibius TaxID=2707525 RepID=A0A6B3L9T7_9BACT|nr:hypothetical protein [Sulfuriroseicoccus oceanibius]QQL46046.1 hypothetical protein G3M56_005550 [Sulfuriroseicoccus oceanibius]
MKWLSLALVMAALSVVSVRADADAKSARLYYAWHQMCLVDDTDAIDRQIARYEKKLKADANDHLAKAYLGSACALRAKASFWGPTKLKFLRRGEKLMNGAVNAAPNDARVRMVRAIGFYKIPKRFDKRPTSLKDFEKLIPVATGKNNALEVNERQAVLYYAWLAFKEEGHEQAAELKAACHRLAPNSKYGKLTK